MEWPEIKNIRVDGGAGHAGRRETRRASRAGRRGITLVEVVVSGVLLGAVMMIAVPTMGWIIRQPRAADRRLEALAEVENIMDRFSARPWEEITAEAAASIALSEPIRRQLPDPELTAAVESRGDQREAKRIHIELSWRHRHGGRAAPVRLTMWVYRNAGGG